MYNKLMQVWKNERMKELQKDRTKKAIKHTQNHKQQPLIYNKVSNHHLKSVSMLCTEIFDK